MPTVQTRSIGSGGRDYATLALFIADVPSNLVSVDEQWIGELYNDSEFTPSATTVISGKTTDATRNIIIRPATGEGFDDDPNAATNALRYNISNGVGFNTSFNYDQVIEVTNTAAYVTIEHLQFDCVERAVSIKNNFTVVKNCIARAQGDYYATGVYTVDAGSLVNNLAVVDAVDGIGISVGYDGPQTTRVINNTIVYPTGQTASAAAGIVVFYGSDHTVSNNLILGFLASTFIQGGAGIAVGSTNNITDNATVDGSNGVVNVPFADQLEDNSISSFDGRLKSGSDAINAAVREQSDTGDEDIIGQARSTTTPDGGCWEFQGSGPPPTEVEDFKIQAVQTDVTGTTATDSTFDPIGLNNTLEFASNNRMVHAGPSGSTGNQEGDDMAGGRVLTATDTLTYYTESGSSTSNKRFNTQLMEYVGDPGGDNEMIVRGRYEVDLNGTTANVSVDLTGDGVVNKDNCIPFITGIMNNATTDDADSATARAYLTSLTNMEVFKGSNGNNVKVYITLVEFTGSNWTVLHGSITTAADTGTITITDSSDGTGTATDVTNWAEAIIFGQHTGDTGQSGTNDAIADNWPTLEPGSDDQSVDFAFNANHDSNGSNVHFAHILNHPDLNVTRYTDTQNAQNESTVDITSASLSDLEQSMIVATSNSSGNGTAYGRGWRNYYLNSLIQAAHWCHRSGNTMSHKIQIIDFSNIKSPSGGITATGDLKSGASQADGAGSVSISGTGSLQSSSAQIIGVATVSINASGSLVSDESSADGSAISSYGADGDLKSDPSIADGSGIVSIVGDGDLVSDDAEIDGSGIAQETIDGSGSLVSDDAIIIGLGEITISTSGSLLSTDAIINGEGEISAIASGTLVSDEAIIDGSGVVEGVISGSGDLVSDDSSIVGFGEITISASGSLVSDGAIIVGSGTISLNASGDLVSDDADIDGSGIVQIQASGDLVSDEATIDGEAVVQGAISGAGDLKSDNSQISGFATTELFASGTLVASTSIIDGEAVVQISGSGALNSDDAIITGSGISVEPVSGSGQLESDDSEISGFAIVQIMSFGALISVDATITGFGTLVVGQTPPDRIGKVGQPQRIGYVDYLSRTGYAYFQGRSAIVGRPQRIGYVKEDDRKN